LFRCIGLGTVKVFNFGFWDNLYIYNGSSVWILHSDFNRYCGVFFFHPNGIESGTYNELLTSFSACDPGAHLPIPHIKMYTYDRREFYSQLDVVVRKEKENSQQPTTNLKWNQNWLSFQEVLVFGGVFTLDTRS